MFYITVACSATILYLLLSPRFCERLYRTKLFYPEPLPEGSGIPSIFGVQGEEVFLSSKNGAVLNARFYRHPQSRFLMLCSHGNRGSIAGFETRVGCLLQAGFSVFIYDYQGFGKSQGRPSIKRVCQDAVAAFDFCVQTLSFGPRDIVLYGASLGGGISCELARVRRCAAIVLQSTFTSFAKISREVSPLGKVFPSRLGIQPALNNLAFVRQYSRPLLVLHGRIDGYIRVRHGRALFDAAASELKQLAILPYEGHPDFGHRDTELLTRALTDFRLALETV